MHHCLPWAQGRGWLSTWLSTSHMPQLTPLRVTRSPQSQSCSFLKDEGRDTDTPGQASPSLDPARCPGAVLCPQRGQGTAPTPALSATLQLEWLGRSLGLLIALLLTCAISARSAMASHPVPVTQAQGISQSPGRPRTPASCCHPRGRTGDSAAAPGTAAGESRDKDREGPFEERQVEKVMRVVRSCTGLCRGGRDSLGSPAGSQCPQSQSWAPASCHPRVPAGLSPPETVLCWAQAH